MSKTTLKLMQKKNSVIPQDILPVFEGISDKYEAMDVSSYGECDSEFVKAMEKHLTKEQRFWLYEQNGACKGTGHDKERKAFADKYADMTIAERVTQFAEVSKRRVVLNDDNTMTVTFKCSHGYYKRAREEKNFTPPRSVESYFERCAGGRLYELQKVLGIKLKIKSVDISPLSENVENPVVFTFEILE